MPARRSINLNTKTPRCPLCLNIMDRKYIVERNMFVFSCDKEKIAIACDDPLAGRWEQITEKIECPNCNASMRFFCTSTGYMKAICPKKSCGATLANSEPDREKPAPMEI